MHTEAKYVTGIVRDCSDRNNWKNTHVAVILPTSINHSDVELLFTVVKSAGFFKLEPDESGFIWVHPYGRSESLNIDSVEDQDTILISKALGLSLVYP